jgi:sulfite exporter TauE/SafE
MWVLLGAVFVASILGSLHCVGMCGPFALLAGNPATNSLEPSSPRRRRSWLIPTAAYSVGRLSTYLIVGLVFGALGMALNRGVQFAAIQQTATYVAGGLMVLVGVVALARQLGWTIKLPTIAGRLQGLLQRHFKLITQQPPLRRAFLIGAFSCLMPCGWLYTFAIVAAGTGSPWQGAVVMVVFWSGTVPIMAALMLGLSGLGSSIQRRIPVAMASMVIVIGIFTIVFRAPVAIGGDTKVVGQNGALIEQVQNIDHAELPCCSGDE